MTATDAGVEREAPGVLDRTRFAIRAAFRRRDARLVLAGVAVGYLLSYLYAIGHLGPGGGEFEARVVDRPLVTLFDRSLGTFSFEPVAVIEAGPVAYLLSLNTLLGAAIAGLVGLNLAITYLAWRQPKACGLGASSAGVFAGIPALLSGAACCGPVVLIALGIQATGVLLSAFDLLVPAALVLLVGSLLLVGRRVDPAALGAASGR